VTSLVPSTQLCISHLFLQIPKQVSRSGICFLSLDVFENEDVEAWVADRAASPMETAAPGSSSKLPAILMILPKDYHLLQKQQHILLAQMTFETFLTPKHEE